MTDWEDDFLGTGWSFPPTFSRSTASVVMVSANRDIQESLWILFSTSLGERIMLPGYGSQLWELVFLSLNTTLIEQLKDFVRQAVLNWEPRIDVDEITVTAASTLEGLVLIDLAYTIRQTNSRSNLVYPFYIGEGTLPPEVP